MQQWVLELWDWLNIIFDALNKFKVVLKLKIMHGIFNFSIFIFRKFLTYYPFSISIFRKFLTYFPFSVFYYFQKIFPENGKKTFSISNF